MNIVKRKINFIFFKIENIGMQYNFYFKHLKIIYIILFYLFHKLNINIT